jgi:hypothetical protein
MRCTRHHGAPARADVGVIFHIWALIS